MGANRNAVPSLTANEMRYIADQIPAMISYVDRSQCFLFVNAAFARWFGKTPDQLIGTQVDELLDPKDRQDRGSYIQDVLRGRKVEFTTHLRHPSGAIHRVQLSYTPDIIPGTDEVQGFTGLLVDLGPKP